MEMTLNVPPGAWIPSVRRENDPLSFNLKTVQNCRDPENFPDDLECMGPESFVDANDVINDHHCERDKDDAH
jgi:hypothetical protein